MNGNTKNNSYVGYEYKEVLSSREVASVYADGYESFGWTLENTSPSLTIGPSLMKFKRDRKLRNKAELTRLQRQFETCVDGIISLEKSRTVIASIAAYTTGILGTAFMAGAIFAYLAGMIPLMILLAIPATVGWILPYLCYRKLYSSQTAKVTPLIDLKYDEIYTVCEKASSLLA